MNKKLLILLVFVVLAFTSIKPINRIKEIKAVKIKKEKMITKIEYLEIDVNSLDDIYEREGNYVYRKINIDLRDFSANKRKEIFIKLLLPSIRIVHKEILNNKKNITILKEKKEYTEEEKKYLDEIFYRYRVKNMNFEELEKKMIIYPTSIILAQGGIESAWGTSRFFREANNAFGIWSANKNEPRIRAGESRGKFTAHLRKYDSLKETVEDINYLVSRATPYKKLRELINSGKKPYDVVEGLSVYSEEGSKYVKKIRNTMKTNELMKYD